MTDTAQLIILNGTSSTGKSSIAKAMQAKTPGVLMHLQLDMYWNMVPDHIEATPTLLPHVKDTVLGMLDTVLQYDHNVVFDTVTMGDDVAKVREQFKKYNPFIVCVHAAQDIVDAREKARGDRKIGLAAEQASKIHKDVVYDFEVDTSVITADQAADAIIAAYARRPTIL